MRAGGDSVRGGGDPGRGGARLAPADVVFRTEREAVVLKPAGLSSEAPASGGRGPETLLVQARALLGWPDAQLPHRLDRPTRGFVVVARDRECVAALNESMRAGGWTKRYLARIAPGGATPQAVDAGPATLIGPHRAYLRREGAVARVVRSGGDPSTLTVDAVAPAPGRPGEWHALVTLGTGRFHQIRAMLAHLGFPLVGDADYGGRPGPMYLDHASLAFVTAAGTRERIALRDDPGRERIAPELIARLLLEE
ncbi:MAG: RNA pseudouridine synthase [Planctomycetes bacterium]|nr:RNA pseudouridine synthase [Planctomycetota bacterium]